ncbi:cytosolic phospholipase A2 gamma-like isoform X1 [Oreochromis aureus]|uniref:PLA2c domain-containing protein n=1 Tax=Oreochromis aureus TaxID=47969 RepID=A0A668RRZ2_OREAU|nr:cytosolic phospholipase A2 gamma-like isoform X1 [Oreochromis aureus]XP_039467006.1 cytosolic phospholipase A2 gamma-like isoform X1 [Oreochromis aureus]
MLCGYASRATGLLCVCIVMMGSMGLPVDNRRNLWTVPQQKNPALSEFKKYVHQSQSLSAGEQEFVLRRKQVVQKSLNKLGITCTLDMVPHIALLGSGGGQRAAVGLMGSLFQMEKDGLLDTVLYLGGVSGSAWSMATLYSDHQWSTNMGNAVSRLLKPGIEFTDVLIFLAKRAKDGHFSLTDIWGVLTSAFIMKQLDVRSLSEDGTSITNPYPIYSTVNKNCLQHDSEKGKWFEMTPHQAGFIDVGLFINTTNLGSRIHGAGSDVKGPELDMVTLQGLVGSALADDESLVNYILDWLKVLVGKEATDENNPLEFLWTKEGIKLNYTASSEMKILELHDVIFKDWGQKTLASLQLWSQNMDEGPARYYVSWFIQTLIAQIKKLEWGKTENFLYQYPDASVPSCIRIKEFLQLIDAGVMINMPYPPFLGEKRDTDVLIALEYGADETFRTLILARDYAAKLKKPFPKLEEKFLKEKDWPRPCYVFKGKKKEPTIVYMPLFNRQNCKDENEFKAKMKEFSTFQLPFSQQKIEFLLETVKANMRYSKDTLLREIAKAVIRRHIKASGGFPLWSLASDVQHFTGVLKTTDQGDKQEAAQP